MKKTICPVLSLFMVFVLGSIGLCGPLNSPIKTLSLEQIRKSAQAESGEMVQFLSRTIQYPSVENSGEGVTPETAALLSFVLTYAQNMGFNVRKAANGMAGVLEYGEGKESVGVLVHLDVVPVSDHERPQWTHPPFSGRITDREVWGRGAQDNKGALASVLWGAKILMDNQATFKRKLQIIIGTKEEKNFEGLIAYFKEFPQVKYGPTFGFVPDGVFISQGEKGIADIEYKFFGICGSKNALQRDTIVGWSGGTALNTVPDFSYAIIQSRNVQKTREELLGVIQAVTRELASGKTDQFYGLSGPLEMDIGLQDYNSFVAENTLEGISKGDLVLFSKGISAHGSTPWTGKNAVVAVALVGSRMSQLSENAYKRAFKFVTAKIGMSTDGSGLGIPFTLSSQLPPVLPGMTPIQYLGTSANLGLVTEEGDQLVLSMNFRTGFVNTNEQLLEASRMSAAVFGGTAEYVKGDGSHYEPFYYTKDQPLLNLVINAYKQVYPAYPEYTPYVFLTPGSTYLKLVSNFVNLGPVDLFPDPSANYFHAKNEHTTIKGQVGNMILYAHTLQKMVQMETAPVR